MVYVRVACRVIFTFRFLCELLYKVQVLQPRFLEPLSVTKPTRYSHLLSHLLSFVFCQLSFRDSTITFRKWLSESENAMTIQSLQILHLTSPR